MVVSEFVMEDLWILEVKYFNRNAYKFSHLALNTVYVTSFFVLDRYITFQNFNRIDVGLSGSR